MDAYCLDIFVVGGWMDGWTDISMDVLVSIVASFNLFFVAKFYCRLAPGADIRFSVAVPSHHVTEG